MNTNFKTKLLFLIVFLNFQSFVLTAQTDDSQNLKIQNLRTIDFESDNKNKNGLFFGQIKGIAVDNDGNIYVSDAMQQTIFKLDSEGKLIQKIGRRGRGPGEFLELGKIFIFDDELLAFDPMQFKIEVFDLDGEAIQAIPTPKGSQVLNFIKYLNEYDEEHFIAYYKMTGFGRFAQYDQDEIFHIWKKDFSEEVNQFGSFDAIGFESEYEKEISDSRGGSCI